MEQNFLFRSNWSISLQYQSFNLQPQLLVVVFRKWYYDSLHLCFHLQGTVVTAMNRAQIHKLHISNSGKVDRQWSEKASPLCPHIADCIGFAWLCFGGRGATGVRRCQKLLPCPAETIPDGSRVDVPPAGAGQIRNGGNASGITDLRKRSKKKVNGQM